MTAHAERFEQRYWANSGRFTAQDRMSRTYSRDQTHPRDRLLTSGPGIAAK